MATRQSKGPNPNAVDLGFVVERAEEPWRLLSHHFPSKVGGRPAWLALAPLPSEADLRCKRCAKPCSFLLQAYAPVSDKLTCFHRTVFIFICRSPECCQPNTNANVVAVRSQLPRRNEFYPETAPDSQELDEGADFPRAEKLQNLCLVCGCAGTKKCGRCQQAMYCSKNHQTVDWTEGGHKNTCGATEQGAKVELSRSAFAGVLFKEFELDYDKEEETPPVEEDEGERSEAERMQEYKSFLDSAGETSAAKDVNLTVAELEKMAMGGKDVEDKQFGVFKERVDRDPEQVLRYQRGGEPLWITDRLIPKPDQVSPCQHCGGPRQFEFQVLPQLLNHLDVDRLDSSVDWGTLVVYTCVQSCEQGAQYGQEFVWKQDFENGSSMSLS